MRLLAAVAIICCWSATVIAGSREPAGVPDAGDGIERSDYAAQLPVGRAILVDNPYGDVHVRFGGFTHTIDIHAVLQQPKGAARIAIEPAANTDAYAVVPRLPNGAKLVEGQRLDLSVLVPEGHTLRVRTGQGDIEVRGLRGDVDLRSDSGNISLRGISGVVQAETDAGRIEASLGKAPTKSKQRLATRTGDVIVGVDDALDAEVELATSGVFATEFSLDVTPHAGQEPNKRARAVIGHERAKLALESKRGEIRLLRRASYISADGKHATAQQAQEQDNDSD